MGLDWEETLRFIYWIKEMVKDGKMENRVSCKTHEIEEERRKWRAEGVIITWNRGEVGLQWKLKNHDFWGNNICNCIPYKSRWTRFHISIPIFSLLLFFAAMIFVGRSWSTPGNDDTLIRQSSWNPIFHSLFRVIVILLLLPPTFWGYFSWWSVTGTTTQPHKEGETKITGNTWHYH